MLFCKVLILFWGVLEHALMLGGSKIAFFSHNLHYYNTALQRQKTVTSIFDEN